MRLLLRNASLHGFVAACVAAISYFVASRTPLDEPYWAPIAAVMVIGDDWRQTYTAARLRFAGTIIGGFVGWAGASVPFPLSVAFPLAICTGVGTCYLLRLGPAARLCAVAIAVIVLIPRAEPKHLVAIHRVLEVTIGTAVSLIWMWAQHRWFGDLTQDVIATTRPLGK